MSDIPVQIDDQEVRDLLKQLPKGYAVSALTRAFNQTLQTLGAQARRDLKEIGATNKVTKVQSFKDRWPARGMILTSRVTKKKVADSGIDAPSIIIRQGRRVNIGKLGAQVYYKRKKQAGVKVKLRKTVKFENAFLIRNKAFIRKNKELEPIITPSEKHYSQSAEVIKAAANKLPPIATATLRRRLIENLTFLINRRNASQEL